MRLLLFDHPQSVTAEELEADLSILPEWRRRKALSFRFDIDRVLCVKAYLLLCRGLREEYGIVDSPSFGFGVNGKPFIEGHPGICFNLSHCRRGVLCVIDDAPVGCDIEEVPSSIDPQLCDACFNEAEIGRISASDDPCVEFSRLWTVKESFLKLTGEGIGDGLPSLFAEGMPADVSFDTVVDRTGGFVYTVCRRRGKDDINII